MPSITFASLKLLAEEIIIPWLVAHHIFDVSVDQIIHVVIFISICFMIAGLYRDAQKMEIEKEKDSSLLNSGWLRVVDFVVTILYPPKLWRFLSMISQKQKLTDKILSEENERIRYMKTNPHKQFTQADLIPVNENNGSMKYEDFSMKGKLEQILRELGMGNKHISLLCNQQLHCTRLEVPEGTDLYKYRDADQYPCLYYLLSGDVIMINEAGTIFREFHAPEDYNVNHLLLPAAALLGRSFNNCIELRTKSKCEVIQYLFKKEEAITPPAGYIDYLRSLSLTLFRTINSPFHTYLRKNSSGVSPKSVIAEVGMIGDLTRLTPEVILSIEEQITEDKTLEEVKVLIKPIVEEYQKMLENGSSLEWDVKVLNKDDQITFQRDELVFLACGEVELYGEDHDVYNQSFTLLNLLPYLLNDKRNVITCNKNHTVLIEFQVLHNTLISTAPMNSLLLDSLVYEFFSLYGDFYYGLNYFWVNDGAKIMTSGTKSSEMMYLLNGRLRSVAYVNQTPETIRYKENKNMKPDWRNQRWTNQQLQHTDKEPVITDYHRGSTFGFSNVINETPMEFSLYSVRNSSILGLCRSFLLSFIRADPQIVTFLSDSMKQENNENNRKYSRISVIPLNHISDYDYFLTCLHRSINLATPTNLVQPEDYLTDNDYYVTEFNDDYEMTLFVGYNMKENTNDKKLHDLWNSIIINESDLVLFTVEINSEESAIKKVLQKTIEEYSVQLKNVRREIVFLYHNNEFNPNHTNNIQLNKWQKELNKFDKSHENIDYYFSTASNSYYPNEIPLYRIRQMLMQLNPSHYHHILINPSPFSQSVDLMNNTSDIRRLGRWLTHTSIGVVFSGGAARGWGHVGVVKAMNELGLPIDMCGGTSAGSLVGAAVAMFRGNYELVREVTRRVAKITSTPMFYVMDFSLPILSLTTGRFMNEVTMDAYSNKLVENTFLPFYAVSTDVTDVSEFVFKSGCLWRYIRASMTVIGLVPPMPDRGMSEHLLVDGGYVNNVPTRAMKNMFDPGVLFTSSVQKLDPPLTQKIGDQIGGFETLLSLINPFRTEPVLTQSSVNTQVMCASSIMQAETTVFEDSDLVIRPSINDVNSAAFQQFDETQEIGYEEAIVRLREWVQGIDRKSPLYRALFGTPDLSD